MAFVVHFISSLGLLLITFNLIPFRYLYREGQGIFLLFKYFAIPVNPNPVKYKSNISFTISEATGSTINLLLSSFDTS